MPPSAPRLRYNTLLTSTHVCDAWTLGPTLKLASTAFCMYQGSLCPQPERATFLDNVLRQLGYHIRAQVVSRVGILRLRPDDDHKQDPARTKVLHSSSIMLRVLLGHQLVTYACGSSRGAGGEAEAAGPQGH